jgi:hypothetical protein
VVQRLARQAEIPAEQVAVLVDVDAPIDWDDGAPFSASGRLALQ